MEGREEGRGWEGGGGNCASSVTPVREKKDRRQKNDIKNTRTHARARTRAHARTRARTHAHRETNINKQNKVLKLNLYCILHYNTAVLVHTPTPHHPVPSLLPDVSMPNSSNTYLIQKGWKHTIVAVSTRFRSPIFEARRVYAE